MSTWCNRPNCDAQTPHWHDDEMPPLRPNAPTHTYNATEQDALMNVFESLLRGPTKDGGAKRKRGDKPPWWRDPAHEPALFSHLNKWKHGQKIDGDSGTHPLVHLAWRALAIAYQETFGCYDPEAMDSPYMLAQLANGERTTDAG